MRRWPDTVVRLREAPGSFDGTGRRTPGAVTETTLPASVQPLGLSSLPGEPGDQYLDRLRLFVPNLERAAAGSAQALAWGASVLLWGGDRLDWGTSTGGGLRASDGAPLAAGFEDRAADRVRLADGRVFKVQMSEAWPGHVEAVLVREP